MRLAVCIFLIDRSLAASADIWLSPIAAVGGVLTLIGLWTPITAALTAAVELWIAMRTGDDLGAHLLALVIAVGIAALGPGAWSVDARLFGRRRITVRDR